MPVRMIVTDLDRTLLRTNRTVSDYTAAVLCRCQERGIKIAFATARPGRATKRFQQKIVPDFVVADNGATIHAGEAVIYSLPIPAATRDALIPALLKATEVSLITVETGDCVYTNYDGPPWEEGWNVVYNDFVNGVKADTPKLSAECENVAFLHELLKNFPELHLYSNSGESWHQIMHRNSTKVNAIRHIAETCGFTIEEVVAFGDDYNDIEMLQFCGIGVAMENAIAEAKAAADHTCETNDNDGVAKWLEAHLLSLLTKSIGRSCYIV